MNYKKNIKSRKRGSHVGVMLSFVIFVTFLLFLYVVVQPSLTHEEKQSFLELVKIKILDRSSSNLITSSVSINDGFGASCVELVNFLSETSINEKLVVNSHEGNFLSSEISGNNLKISINSNSFFRVYGSEEFSVPDGSLSECTFLEKGTGYEIGLVRNSEEIFETKIIELIGDYKDNYSGLKQDMGILPGNEFDFSFTYDNGTTIVAGGQEISGRNIYIDENSIQYINHEGLRKIGSISVRVW